METTPVTATTAVNLDDRYSEQLIHVVSSRDSGQIVEIAWSQYVNHRGRRYTHRRITDRSDYSVQNQWFRVG